MTLQNNMAEDKPTFDHPQSQSNQPAFGQIDGDNPDLDTLINQVKDLSDKVDRVINTHIHDGSQAQRINLNTDILGMIETVSTAPTLAPNSLFGQFKFYSNAGTFRLYVFDVTGNTWHYTALT